jgi:hypothetical protein
VLFRQFIELLVRTAYIKYGNINELHKSMERMLTKITPVIDSFIRLEKKETGSSVDGMSSVSFNAKRDIPAYARTSN